jgi:lactoylglutathione lyase
MPKSAKQSQRANHIRLLGHLGAAEVASLNPWSSNMSTEKRPQQALTPSALLHTMLRVSNLDRSIAFYVGLLGMTLFRKEEYPEGRFTLAFVGYGNEDQSAAIELTHNWDTQDYEHGSAYGHVALRVANIERTCRYLAEANVRVVRAPGPMTHSSPQRQAPENIAFVADPDGYRLELIEHPGAC